ncbi:MAG: DUF1080 domain-containing protein [Propionicimonas sp.]
MTRLMRRIAVAAAAISLPLTLIASAPSAQAAPTAPDPGSLGWKTIFDGTESSLKHWKYTGIAQEGASNGGFDLLPDGSLVSRGKEQGGTFGTLVYTRKRFADFELRLQFKDMADGDADVRGNSGVHVRFPDPWSTKNPCLNTPTGKVLGAPWTIIECGHEIQINDGTVDPRTTGSIYGFKDLSLAQSGATPKGTWNELVIRVVGQKYTVTRNGKVINTFLNSPGLPFPDRPTDPGSDARGLVGYVGLQTHGSAADRIAFRNIQVRDLTVKKVAVAQQRFTLAKGSFRQLEAAGYTAAGTSVPVTYKSSRPGVVQVTKQGVILARKVGTATITIKAGKVSTKVTVKVVKPGKPKARKFVLSGVPQHRKLTVGSFAYLTVSRFAPARSITPKVSYHSSRPGVVWVDRSGRLVALKAGTAVITVKAGTAQKTIALTVKSK